MLCLVANTIKEHRWLFNTKFISEVWYATHYHARSLKLRHLYLCNAFRSRILREIQKLDIKKRTELNGVSPTELYIVAQKVKDRSGTLVLQQGDYEEKWSGNNHENTFVKKLKEILPWEVQCVLKHFGLMWQSRKILKKIKL